MTTIRKLTTAEKTLARSMFGASIDLDIVEVRRRKWWPFQPRNVVMAPCGHLHFHPKGTAWREDFATASPGLRAFFLHELCHVWQSQHGMFLPLRRLPFARYSYVLKPGKRFLDYGIEQQAEIVANTYLMREGLRAATSEERAEHEALVAELLG